MDKNIQERLNHQLHLIKKMYNKDYRQLIMIKYLNTLYVIIQNYMINIQ